MRDELEARRLGQGTFSAVRCVRATSGTIPAIRDPDGEWGRLADPRLSNMECLVYQKPAVQKFGSFRELTQVGFLASSDGASALGIGNDGSGCWTDADKMLHCPTAS